MNYLIFLRQKLIAIHYILCLFILIAGTGCIHLISYYDANSYKNLTDLKGEMKVFFEKASNGGVQGVTAYNALQDFKIKMSKAYEYEKGKKLNDDTIVQFRTLNETLQEVLDRFMKSKWINNTCNNDSISQKPETGCFSVGYSIAKWKILEAAFDIAIETERSKLKEKE